MPRTVLDPVNKLRHRLGGDGFLVFAAAAIRAQKPLRFDEVAAHLIAKLTGSYGRQMLGELRVGDIGRYRTQEVQTRPLTAGHLEPGAVCKVHGDVFKRNSAEALRSIADEEVHHAQEY